MASRVANQGLLERLYRPGVIVLIQLSNAEVQIGYRGRRTGLSCGSNVADRFVSPALIEQCLPEVIMSDPIILCYFDGMAEQ